jgi:hypothetical protein
MLALLLVAPRSPQDWSRWSFHHRQSHDAIRNAIREKLSINLPEYVLEPISDYAPRNFLENNQSAHTDMNGALNRPASDLEEVDFTNESQLRAWIYLHWQEHNVAENTLHIGS